MIIQDFTKYFIEFVLIKTMGFKYFLKGKILRIIEIKNYKINMIVF